jgi:hypothetical protein
MCRRELGGTPPLPSPIPHRAAFVIRSPSRHAQGTPRRIWPPVASRSFTPSARRAPDGRPRNLLKHVEIGHMACYSDRMSTYSMALPPKIEVQPRRQQPGRRCDPSGLRLRVHFWAKPPEYFPSWPKKTTGHLGHLGQHGRLANNRGFSRRSQSLLSANAHLASHGIDQAQNQSSNLRNCVTLQSLCT